MSILASFIVPHPPLIVPEIGKGEEVLIQKTIDSYHIVAKQIKDYSPETIILISPHSISYSDYIHISPGKQAKGSFNRFGSSSEILVNYDWELVNQISFLCDEAAFPAGTLGERGNELDHGTLVPLHFINQYYTRYNLIRCSISGLSRQDHYFFGMIIKEAVEKFNRDIVIISSGDLSHKLSKDGPYGFAPEGFALDKKLVAIMDSGNFDDFFELDPTLCNKGAECGLASFITMAGILDQKSIESEFLSYEGPFGVGYAVCAYKVLGDDISRNFLDQNIEKNKLKLKSIREKEDIFVQIARQALESYISTGSIPPLPKELPDELISKQAGVFVSIKKDNKLRGCIGTICPTQPNIALEIQNNAVSSGTHDSRFSPVNIYELPDLVYSVDVLSKAESISDKSMLDTKQYGVIVTSGFKRGLLLPNLEGVDSVDEQIHIACEKAGIKKGDDYTLERFKVTRHKCAIE